MNRETLGGATIARYQTDPTGRHAASLRRARAQRHLPWTNRVAAAAARRQRSANSIRWRRLRMRLPKRIARS